MLVIALLHQGHRAHQRGVRGADRVLQVQSQGQVGAPVGVVQPAVVGAHQQHDLACADPGFLRHGLVDHAVCAQGVPVHVDDHGDAGVLLQIALHRRAGALVGAGIAGVVIDLPVVDHVQPRLLEKRRQFVTDTDNVVVRILGAVGVAGLIAVQPGRGVGFAGMGMDDENLGLTGWQLHL